MDTFANRIQTVSDVTRSLKGLLEISFPLVTVSGEISNLRRPYSGHIYFTLKDKEAQLRAVLFKPQQRYLNEPLQDGMEVVCRGRISIYEKRGEYQLIVDVVDGLGAGALQVAFEELKQRLASEGLFDQARKRTLSFLPKRVGVITSPGGAALHDFLHMAEARFPGLPIEIYPVRVQGDGAAVEIVDALKMCNYRNEVDTIVICRGGGSIEDLWTFNEESVARAIFDSVIPVVVAVGHEIDYTIADFVADHRAPTPTAAAEVVMPDRDYLLTRLHEQQRLMVKAMDRILVRGLQKVYFLRRTLTDPSVILAQYKLRLDNQQNHILQGLQNRLRRNRVLLDGLAMRLMEQNPRERVCFYKKWVAEIGKKMGMMIAMHLERKLSCLQRSATLLDAVSPLAILGRGYAIARTPLSGEVIRDTGQVKKGDLLQILLRNGILDCEVIGKGNSR